MYGCRFLNCNKCTTQVGDVDSGWGERLCMCGGGGYMGNLCLLLSFAVNLKLL